MFPAVVMATMEEPDVKLSSSEKRTLQEIAQGALPSMLDWIAVQPLKTFGYVEECSTGLAVTEEGRRAMRRLTSKD